MDEIIIKPVLKWTGSKSRSLSVLVPGYLDVGMLKEGRRYIEPFAGSCSVALRLNFSRMVLNDLNAKLMKFYEVLCGKPEKLYRKIMKVRAEFDRVRDKEACFYEMRGRYNKLKVVKANEILRSALFWFLNKTCFNGMYREDSKGNYNIPYGQRDCPEPDLGEFLAMAGVLGKCELFHCGFGEICGMAESGDVVYLDPPYIPMSRTASFSDYLKHGFGLENHQELCRLMDMMTNRGVIVVMSNSSTAITKRIYGRLSRFKFHTHSVQRLISGRVKGRGKVDELIMTNYDYLRG